MSARVRAAGLVALALVLVVVALAVPRVPAPVAPAPSAARDAAVPAPPSASPSAAPRSSAPSAPPDDSAFDYDIDALAIPEQREAMLKKMGFALGLDAATLEKLRAIVTRSDWMSQGNPKITKHPMSRAECRERRRAAQGLATGDPRCAAANMVPLGEPEHDGGASRLSCIDQYEFPNVACEYPLVWVRANEASELCHALGKRLCDAHEWEGACAGNVKSPDVEYEWDQPESEKRRINMEYFHNLKREIVWAYGKEQNHALCATSSRKSPKCFAGGFTLCGTNDFPAGAFPECVSPLGVYDQHGNAAEHMNLPMKPDELGSRGGSGETEMKGSWFIFLQAPAHPDDCRFRAPGWHASKVLDPNSHRNYHLGFRCCKDLSGRDGTSG